MLRVLAMLGFLVVSSHCYAQDDYFDLEWEKREKRKKERNSHFNGGFGLGIAYAGHIGTKVSYLPFPWLSVFGSVGLYFYETGFATGIQLILPSEKRVEAYLTFMYGVNAGFGSSKGYVTQKIYFGTSVGCGIQLKGRNSDKFFWNLELAVPFRDQQFYVDAAALTAQGVELTSSTWPVVISLGVHFKLNWNDF